MNGLDGKEVLDNLARRLQPGSNPNMMARALGLSLHPGTTAAKGNLDAIYRKIVYRYDPWSKYRQAVSVKTEGDGPDDRGDPPP
eukprot:5386175-Pyramimonas_sp.AAC.1